MQPMDESGQLALSGDNVWIDSVNGIYVQDIASVSAGVCVHVSVCCVCACA